jgi:lipoyl(octanoyl) transferase
MHGPGVESVQVARLGRCEYATTLDAMRRFTAGRRPGDADRIWLLEHPPVYTRGVSCRQRPRVDNGIPVVDCDRGGQITYHGPGQIVVYLMIDLHRLGTGIRAFVHAVEQAVIDALADLGIEAGRRPGAPGVYVGDRKVAALGLRVRSGCTYHGLSINHDMDLAPFDAIDPCGHAGLEVTDLVRLGVAERRAPIEERLVGRLVQHLGLAEGRGPRRAAAGAAGVSAPGLGCR